MVSMKVMYVIVAALVLVILVLLTWLTTAKSKSGNYVTGTLGGWVILFGVILYLLGVYSTAVPAISEARDGSIKVGARLLDGLFKGASQAEDPTELATSFVQWDATKASILRDGSKVTPIGWNVAMTDGVNCFVVEVGTPVPVAPAVTPKVYFAPTPEYAALGKKPTSPLPFPR